MLANHPMDKEKTRVNWNILLQKEIEQSMYWKSKEKGSFIEHGNKNNNSAHKRALKPHAHMNKKESF